MIRQHKGVAPLCCLPDTVGIKCHYTDSDGRSRDQFQPYISVDLEVCSLLNVFPRRERHRKNTTGGGHKVWWWHLKYSWTLHFSRLKATVKPCNILWPYLMKTNQSHFDFSFILKLTHSWIRCEKEVPIRKSFKSSCYNNTICWNSNIKIQPPFLMAWKLKTPDNKFNQVHFKLWRFVWCVRRFFILILLIL